MTINYVCNADLVLFNTTDFNTTETVVVTAQTALSK